MAVRSHIVYLFFLAVAISLGVVLAQRGAVEAAPESQPLPRPVTTDLRHPVAVYWIPPHLTTQQEIVDYLGLVLYPQDKVWSRPGIEYGLGGQFVVERAQLVTVRDAGAERTYRTWAATVGELLSEQQVEIGTADRVEPVLATSLALDQVVTITRVSVSEVTKVESIPFHERIVEDPEQPKGKRTVVQAGVRGSKTLTYEVTRENGVEVRRELIKTEVTDEPIEQVVSLGTKVTVLGQGKASWYKTPWGGLTAAHNTLPKGTMVEVTNLKNGKKVIVKINDRGIQTDAIIDLSSEAFAVLEPLGTGIIPVRLELAS